MKLHFINSILNLCLLALMVDVDEEGEMWLCLTTVWHAGVTHPWWHLRKWFGFHA